MGTALLLLKLSIWDQGSDCSCSSSLHDWRSTASAAANEPVKLFDREIPQAQPVLAGAWSMAKPLWQPHEYYY